MSDHGAPFEYCQTRFGYCMSSLRAFYVASMSLSAADWQAPGVSSYLGSHILATPLASTYSCNRAAKEFNTSIILIPPVFQSCFLKFCLYCISFYDFQYK
jgi:hypothetical protein